MEEKKQGEQIIGSFGEYIRKERETRGFSLEEIAEHTKISIRALRALEAEDWEILPAEVYVRGFIKCYAETIGIDPLEALDRYQKSVAPFRKKKENTMPEKKYLEPPKKKVPITWIVIGILLFILILGGFLFLKGGKKGKEEISTLQPSAPQAIPAEKLPAKKKNIPSKKSLKEH